MAVDTEDAKRLCIDFEPDPFFLIHALTKAFFYFCVIRIRAIERIVCRVLSEENTKSMRHLFQEADLILDGESSREIRFLFVEART